jgi:hypothetical protein
MYLLKEDTMNKAMWMAFGVGVFATAVTALANGTGRELRAEGGTHLDAN